MQKRCDTCISILYELNYLCPFLGPPVLFYLWFCRPTSMIAQEVILVSKDLPSPCIEGTEKVDYTVYIWYNVSIKYRRCFYDRTTAEIDAKSIHGNI